MAASLLMLSISSLIEVSAASRTGWTRGVRNGLRGGEGQDLTIGGRCRMRSREDGLRASGLSLEGLSDCSNLVSDFGVVVDLGLELLEDSRVDHSWGRHCHGGVKS